MCHIKKKCRHLLAGIASLSLLLSPACQSGESGGRVIGPEAQAGDFAFLASYLHGSRLVILEGEGEEAENIRWQTLISRYLLESQSFDALVLEDSFTGAFATAHYRLRDTARAYATLSDAEWSAQLKGLLSYLDRQESVRLQPVQYGTDLTMSRSTLFTQWVLDMAELYSASFGEEVRQSEKRLRALTSRFRVNKKSIDPVISDSLTRTYRRLQDSMVVYRQEIIYEKGLRREWFPWLLQCIENRIFLAQYLALPDSIPRTLYRQEAMANNTQWLLSRFRPEMKGVLWDDRSETHDSAPELMDGVWPGPDAPNYFTLAIRPFSKAPQDICSRSGSLPGTACFVLPSGVEAIEQATLFYSPQEKKIQ